MNIINLDSNGLIPTIVQHLITNEVLMLGYMSEESLIKTKENGDVWFYSRSRSVLWHKGETSGNFLRAREIYIDCDGDTLLVKVIPEGPTCHTGNNSCFQKLAEHPEYIMNNKGSNVIDELYAVIEVRKLNTQNAKSYTNELFKEGTSRIAQKVIEEAGEFAIASAELAIEHNSEKEKQVSNELADLIYHSLVLLASLDLSPEDVWEVLRNRRKGLT
jgi:phosphoribosyl-ATP pyrophosphohydrolase/phosphoribosyl-AMP cyclohydrolase